MFPKLKLLDFKKLSDLFYSALTQSSQKRDDGDSLGNKLDSTEKKCLDNQTGNDQITDENKPPENVSPEGTAKSRCDTATTDGTKATADDSMKDASCDTVKGAIEDIVEDAPKDESKVVKKSKSKTLDRGFKSKTIEKKKENIEQEIFENSAESHSNKSTLEKKKRKRKKAKENDNSKEDNSVEMRTCTESEAGNETAEKKKRKRKKTKEKPAADQATIPTPETESKTNIETDDGPAVKKKKKKGEKKVGEKKSSKTTGVVKIVKASSEKKKKTKTFDPSALVESVGFSFGTGESGW